MAKGTAPLFSTAPRIEIRVGDTKIAYAIGLNLNISVDIQPVRIVGQFGPVSLEPTRYNPVTGTMQIIRLASTESYAAMQFARDSLKKDGRFTDSTIAEAMVQKDGQQVAEPADSVSASVKDGQVLSQGGLYQHLDPAEVLVSRAFDVSLYMRIPDKANGNVQTALGADEATLPTDPQSLYTSVPWLKIINCRITSRNVNISQGQLVNEPISFQGLMATPIDETFGPLFALDSSNGQT